MEVLIFRYVALSIASLFMLIVGPVSGQALASPNPSPPEQSVRLIFIHHSTGQNWLADDNGGLGQALSDNNYFVSDTNYGWGPDAIGDQTDIGNWWSWFRGPSAATYLENLYSESGQHSSYSRLATAPTGSNEVVMFKSCFPNSALLGNPADPPPAIVDNPLKGQDSGSVYHTVANAKSIYIDLLDYFRTRQDKLFIVIAAPPLRDSTYADNARAFNDWLTNDWLREYPYRNVAVFDFYNVLTTNGGTVDINDLGSEIGNHHRWWQGAIQHKTDGDDDSNPNILEYPSGDDHPSQSGNQKATNEFLPLLNIYYNNWKALDPPITADGDINGDSYVTIADALLALRITVKLHVATATELVHGDCAPFVNNRPDPDRVIDIRDALMILRKVVKLADW